MNSSPSATPAAAARKSPADHYGIEYQLGQRIRKMSWKSVGGRKRGFWYSNESGTTAIVVGISDRNRVAAILEHPVGRRARFTITANHWEVLTSAPIEESRIRTAFEHAKADAAATTEAPVDPAPKSDAAAEAGRALATSLAARRARQERWSAEADANIAAAPKPSPEGSLAIFQELIDAARKARATIDVSTIRPGKRVEAQWTEVALRLDAAIAKAEREQAAARRFVDRQAFVLSHLDAIDSALTVGAAHAPAKARAKIDEVRAGLRGGSSATHHHHYAPAERPGYVACVVCGYEVRANDLHYALANGATAEGGAL